MSEAREWCRNPSSQQLATSYLCQHPDGRPASWFQIFDCFHCRGARSKHEEQGHIALYEPEILEADLCMWRRSLLMEDWWRQGGDLGSDGKVADSSESLSPLRTGTWHHAHIEWRMRPCEEHRFQHRDDQAMYRSSSGHPQCPCRCHSRHYNWLGTDHLWNEWFEGLDAETSMDRHPPRSFLPRTIGWYGWALGRSHRAFRDDVQELQELWRYWQPKGHLHSEPYYMIELRQQLDPAWNVWASRSQHGWACAPE